MTKEMICRLSESIRDNDFYILVIALVTLGFGVFTLGMAVCTSIQARQWKRKRNKLFSRFMCKSVRWGNTVFVNLVSIFPQLGLLGTVAGLLGLNLFSGDMTNLTDNFLIALTSTGWGVIFSIGFKAVYAFFVNFIEDQIALAKGLTEDTVENAPGKER